MSGTECGCHLRKPVPDLADFLYGLVASFGDIIADKHLQFVHLVAPLHDISNVVENCSRGLTKATSASRRRAIIRTIASPSPCPPIAMDRFASLTTKRRSKGSNSSADSFQWNIQPNTRIADAQPFPRSSSTIAASVDGHGPVFRIQHGVPGVHQHVLQNGAPLRERSDGKAKVVQRSAQVELHTGHQGPHRANHLGDDRTDRETVRGRAVLVGQHGRKELLQGEEPSSRVVETIGDGVELGDTVGLADSPQSVACTVKEQGVSREFVVQRQGRDAGRGEGCEQDGAPVERLLLGGSGLPGGGDLPQDLTDRPPSESRSCCVRASRSRGRRCATPVPSPVSSRSIDSRAT